jgi:hypothetical protein
MMTWDTRSIFIRPTFLSRNATKLAVDVLGSCFKIIAIRDVTGQNYECRTGSAYSLKYIYITFRD